MSAPYTQYAPFLSLLRIALGTQTSLPRPLTAEEWASAYAVARRQWLVGVLMDGIEQLPPPAKGTPPPSDMEKAIRLDWYGQCTFIEQTNLRMQAVVAMLPGQQLKGLAVGRYYPHPQRRQSGDIDMWMPEGRKAVLDWARQNLKDCEKPNAFHISCPSYHGVPVELHWVPTIMHNPWLNHRLRRYYAQMAAHPKDSSESLADRPLVYLLHHAFNHFLTEGIGLRHIVDIYYVLRSQRATEEEILTLHSLHLTRFMAAVGYILHHHLGLSLDALPLPPDARLGEVLMQECMVGGNLGHNLDHSRGVRLLARRMGRVLRLMRFAPAEVPFIPLISTWSGLIRRFGR